MILLLSNHFHTFQNATFKAILLTDGEQTDVIYDYIDYNPPRGFWVNTISGYQCQQQHYNFPHNGNSNSTDLSITTGNTGISFDNILIFSPNLVMVFNVINIKT